MVLALVQTGGLGFMVGANILLQMLRPCAGLYTLRDVSCSCEMARRPSRSTRLSPLRQIFWFMVAVEAAAVPLA